MQSNSDYISLIGFCVVDRRVASVGRPSDSVRLYNSTQVEDQEVLATHIRRFLYFL